jgi:hypothetical protein
MSKLKFYSPPTEDQLKAEAFKQGQIQALNMVMEKANKELREQLKKRDEMTARFAGYASGVIYRIISTTLEELR